jgi:hypothetical protein
VPIIIYDRCGQELKKLQYQNLMSLPNSVNINIGDLNPGLYYIRIITSNKSVLKKLMVVR